MNLEVEMKNKRVQQVVALALVAMMVLSLLPMAFFAFWQ